MKRFFLILALIFPLIANAVIRDVCASCTYTDIASATTAAGASDIIELREDITDENLDLDKNIAGIQSDNGLRLWNGTGSGSAHTLDINNGLTQAFTVRNLIIDHDTSSAQTIRITGRGAGQAVVLQDLDIRHTSASGSEIVQDAAGGIAANELIIQRCKISGTGGDTGFRQQNNTVAGSSIVKNCVIINNTNGIRLSSFTANEVVKIFNNTIEGNTEGLLSADGSEIKNNIFANNTSDIAFSGDASVADLITNAFEEQTDTGGFGSGNIFGIVSEDEFVDEGNDDFNLKISSQFKDAGTDLTSEFNDDFIETFRPQGGGFDLGAYELIVEFLMLDNDLTRRGIQ